jgi:hypothetical protein
VVATTLNEILEQAADVVVHEGRAHGGLEAEAAPQAARDVVLAPAFPDLELAGGADASRAGIETQHDLAERDLVEGTTGCGLEVEGGHGGRHDRKSSGRRGRVLRLLVLGLPLR